MNLAALVIAPLLLQAPAPAPAGGLLAKEPSGGGVVWREDVPELGLASATLSNGVRLQVRSLPGPQAFVSVVMPGGELRETAANRGISAAAAAAIAHPGSARVPPAAIEQYLKGKTVALSAEAEADAITLRLQTTLADLEPGLRLAHLIFTEGRLEPDVFRRWQDEAAAQARARANEPARRLEQATRAAVLQDDPRVRPPEPERLSDLGAAAVEAWLNAHLREAPLEVTLVANLPKDDLIALGMKYFASLPRRRLQDSTLTPLRQLPQRRGPSEERLELPAPKQTSARAWVRVGCRIPPEVDARGARVLALARPILAARLKADLQQKRQLIAGDPEVAIALSRALPAERALTVTLLADPARAADAASAARAVVEQLVRSGPTAAELTSARQELLAATESAQAAGPHWASLLEGFDYRGGNRADLSRAPREVPAYSRKDLVGLLRRCVTADRRVQIVAVQTH